MDEEALVARAKEEREKIFLRYDKGREQGAEIDPWEDPMLEEYHKMDRYGFIHDVRLPEKRDPLEVKETTIELEREKKWLKLLGNQMVPAKRPWNDRVVQAKVRKRAYKGIPEKVRGSVWHKLLKLEEVMQRGEGKYERMLELGRHWSSEARQIDKDVNRQFRDNSYYRERYSTKQKSLFNVLVAYSMYNSEVGYCQGMSGLAGVLLMYMGEEETFWALSVLFADPKYAMHGLFIEGFPKLNRFLAHHDKIITKFIPKLKKHFDRCNLDSILYSLKWFFVVFIERIPFSLCLRVWDIYLLDGEKVVTAMAFNILRMHKARLLKLRDMDQIVQYIQTTLSKDFGYDNDTVVKNLEHCMEDLRKAGLELPPPPSEIELPKKPFGVFVEPTAAAQIGRRKQEFTETEKDVTETVKLKREITEQEIANLDRIAPGGSTQQLNAVHIPESEDGGSLLGSSRKSLADTSVTSTADLSVVSGGQSQRSHQPFDFCVDEEKVIPSEDEGDGESSPVSAIGSTSVVERSPSALQFMTPRAMSPHDVVRIYVPPAPPEEHTSLTQHHLKEDRHTFERPSGTVNGGQLPQARDRSSRGSVFHNEENDEDEEARTRRNSEIDFHLHQADTGGPLSFSNNGEMMANGMVGASTMTPMLSALSYGSGRFSDYASGDFQGHTGSPLVAGSVQPPSHYASNGRSTSSSRRGSMSRKSPAPTLDSDYIIECSHVKNRKYVPDHHSSHNNLVPGLGGSGDRRSVAAGSASRNGSESNIHRMTSFEELAKVAKLQQQQQHHSSGTGGFGSGNIMPRGGSTSSLLRNNASQEDCYVVRQTVMMVTKPNVRMARSEIYETLGSREHPDDAAVRRSRPSLEEEERYDAHPGEKLVSGSIQSRKSSRGHKSDYSIQYRNLSPKAAQGPVSPQSDGAGDGTTGGSEWSSGVEYRALKVSPSRQNSGNDSSPVDYDPLPPETGGTASGVPSKLYSRFFNNDEDEGEEEDEDERVRTGEANPQTPYSPTRRDDEDKLLLLSKHSSDDSSTSPPPPQGTATRPSQLPQYHHHRPASAFGSQQRQRPRQRQPESRNHSQNGAGTPTGDMVPLLPASSPPAEAPSRSSPTITNSSSLQRGQHGIDSIGSLTSSIPVNSSIHRRKHSSTESTNSIPAPHQPSASSGRRRPSNDSSSTAPSQPTASANVSPSSTQSRIPVSGIVKSPISPTGSLRHKGAYAPQSINRTRVPTTNSFARSEGPASPQTFRRTDKAAHVSDERLPSQYQYGAIPSSVPPGSLALSPTLPRLVPVDLPLRSPASGGSSSRLGSSRSAHQITQPDANRIRIQVNPSPAYGGKSGG